MKTFLNACFKCDVPSNFNAKLTVADKHKEQDLNRGPGTSSGWLVKPRFRRGHHEGQCCASDPSFGFLVARTPLGMLPVTARPSPPATCRSHMAHTHASEHFQARHRVACDNGSGSTAARSGLAWYASETRGDPGEAGVRS